MKKNILFLITALLALQVYATDYILVSTNPNSSLTVPDDSNASFLKIVPSLTEAQNFIYSSFISNGLNWADVDNVIDDVIVYIEEGIYSEGQIIWTASSPDYSSENQSAF